VIFQKRLDGSQSAIAFDNHVSVIAQWNHHKPVNSEEADASNRIFQLCHFKAVVQDSVERLFLDALLSKSLRSNRLQSVLNIGKARIVRI
jgi:hypothetical protein